MGSKKKKEASVSFAVLFLLCLGMVLFAGWKLYGIWQEYALSRENYDALAQQYAIALVPETEAVAESVPEESTVPGETAPIQVDFDSLLKEGPEIIGWLYSEGTPINYPLVQHEDNDYYLDRLPDGRYSGGGSIFMECTNSPDFSDWNNIFYGHNMNNDSMFGSLTDYRRQQYYEKHPVMYLLTPDQDYKIILLGGYITQSTSDTYSIPEDEAGRDYLAAKATDNSSFISALHPESGQRLITLSTCSYEFDEARYVLVGALEPISKPALPEKD